jgi:hypothetical protein
MFQIWGTDFNETYLVGRWQDLLTVIFSSVGRYASYRMTVVRREIEEGIEMKGAVLDLTTQIHLSV